MAMKIAMLVLDHVFDSGLTTMLDAFATANELAQLQGDDSRPFEVSLVGVRDEVVSAQGLRIPLGRLTAEATPDWIVVPAIGYKLPEALTQALARADIADAVALLRHWADAGVKIAAGCIGTFVLAESGLLDGHESTTTWWLGPFFRQRYPRIKLDPERLIVPSGRFVTSGAALSHIDLALWLIRGQSPDLAGLVARYLIVDSRPSQSVYMLSGHLASADPLVERFDHWVRANLSQAFSLEQAADAMATSKRTLARRLQTVLGKSPLQYVQDLRVERAVHLIKTSDLNVERIAEAVGYANGTTLATLIRQRLGVGIREMRRHTPVAS